MQQRLTTVRILWGALLGSTLMFLVMLRIVVNPEPNPMPLLPPVLGIVALSVAVLSFVVPNQQLKAAFERSTLEVREEADPNASSIIPYRDAPRRRVFAHPDQAGRTAFVAYQPALILGCALSESIALFGWVLGFLGHPVIVYMPFFVVGWVLLAVRFPTLARVRGPLERAKGAVFPA